MKNLMTSTIAVLALSTSAFADAHADKAGMTAYEASDLIGMRVYTGNTDEPSDTWEDIGEINDLLITMNGEVPSAILGVGGLLGIGESEVELSLDMIDQKIADDGERFLVVGMSQEQLEALPEYDETRYEASMMTDSDASEPAIADARPIDEEVPATTLADAEGDMRDGYLASDLASLEANQLQGLTVYSQNDENVGEISELILGENGQIDKFIVDVGGFIGLGEKPVALTAAELSIMEQPETNELRAIIQPTTEQLEAMPEYEG